MKKNRNSKEKNDKGLIISRLKIAYKFKTDTDLARFLGVSPNTITSWKVRNSIDYDLIFAKCENVDYNLLLTGKGEMLRNNNIECKNSNSDNPVLIEAQKETIEAQKETIQSLKERIESLKKEIQAVDHVKNAIAG